MISARLGIGVVILFGLPAGGLGQDTPRDLLNAMIQSRGGADKLAKLDFVQTRGKGTLRYLGQEFTFTDHTVQRLPEATLRVAVMETSGRKLNFTQCVTENFGWVAFDHATRDLDMTTVEILREEMHVAHVLNLAVLRGGKFALAVAPAKRIAGKSAPGIKVTHPGMPDVVIFADPDTKLPVKCEATVRDAELRRPILQEVFFYDYQDRGGVQVPIKQVVYRDGAKFMDLELTEVKFAPPPERSVFAKPK